MKTILRSIIAIIVFVANLFIAGVCGMAVANFMVDTLDLVGLWVFIDGTMAALTMACTFLVLEHGAYVCNLGLDDPE